MNFNNIHIDHIKPVSRFNLDDHDEFLKCCHYTNMQPLTKAEHKKKTSEEAKERNRLKREGKRV